MRTVTDEAIVIGLMDYRESDRIVTLFTREHGKISGIARSARKSRKRFGGALELFACLKVSFTPAEGLVPVKNVDIVTIYPRIRDSFSGIAHAGYACELVAAFLPEGLANGRAYRLLMAYLEHLDKGEFGRSDRYFFEMNLLNILGYRPSLEICSECGALLAEKGGRFSLERSWCSSCARDGSGKLLGASTVAVLLQALTVGRFGVVSFEGNDMAEAEGFLDACIASNLQRPLKSLAFLRLSP
jgi:DNA repair protein RecO (recombination protein O)